MMSNSLQRTPLISIKKRLENDLKKPQTKVVQKGQINLIQSREWIHIGLVSLKNESINHKQLIDLFLIKLLFRCCF